MPNLKYEQSLEVTSIYSAAGFNIENFIFTPPFRSPHHSSSLVSIIGGGTNPRPGEVTLAHHGVLFLDELPEFKRDVIEALREPLESGEITIARAKKTIKFPAKFLLIAASNPCPCGFYKDEEKECICSINEIKKYSKKLSGPILDRIDILINVPRIKGEEIFKEKEINFKKIIDKIKELKEIQLKRQGKYNGELLAKELKDYCKLDLNSENLLSEAADKMKISLRGIHKIIKIARTIADLNNNDKIKQEYIAQAIHYHLQDKEKLITV
jgi:magnesium chelatase family protein